MSSEGKPCAGAQSQAAQAATAQNASKQTDALQISYHGIAARMDRLPISNFHRKLLWLLGGVVFCDSIDMGIGGPIIAQLLATGWSDAGLNSLFVSITMLGYFFGGLMAGALSDSIGRKKAVIIFCLFFTVGCFAAAFSPDMYFLIVCRFIMGLGLGAAYPAAYSALMEFTPAAGRGKYQAYVGLIANTGTLVASALNLLILPLVGWRPVFIFCGFLGLFMAFLCAKFLQESPRWLAMMGRDQEANAIVTKFEDDVRSRGVALAPVPDQEIKEREEQGEVKQLPWRFLFSKKMLTRTLTAMFLCFAMNVCVYTVVTWTPTIFVMRGFDVGYSVMMTVVMQLGIPVGVGLLSLYVEKVNRKTILIVSFILIAVLGYGWSLIPADNVYLVMFVGFLVCMVTYTNSVTISAIYLPEPFPTACRTRGAGIANAFGRIAGVISPIWITALLATTLGATAVYMINAGIAIFMAIWVAIFAVETRGKTLEEINEGVLGKE